MTSLECNNSFRKPHLSFGNCSEFQLMEKLKTEATLLEASKDVKALKSVGKKRKAEGKYNLIGSSLREKHPNYFNWDRDDDNLTLDVGLKHNDSSSAKHLQEENKRCRNCHSKLTLYERFFNQCRCGKLSIVDNNSNSSDNMVEKHNIGMNRKDNSRDLSTLISDTSKDAFAAAAAAAADDDDDGYYASSTAKIEQKEYFDGDTSIYDSSIIKSSDNSGNNQHKKSSQFTKTTIDVCDESIGSTSVNYAESNSQPTRIHIYEPEKRHVYRNDYAYKQKICDLFVDNRISFHCRQQFYKGEEIATYEECGSDTQNSSNTNIVQFVDNHKDYISVDRLLAESLSAESSESLGFSYNPQIRENPNPNTIMEWRAHAEQIRLDAKLKRDTKYVVRSECGFSIILVLDCSARMKGQKFETMTKAAKFYINGIKTTMHGPARDNIGLAIFGGTSTLLSPPTCDYDMLMMQIEQLTPHGNAPLFGGLLMGLAGAQGVACSTGIGGYTFFPFVVMFTDNQSQNTSSNHEGYGMNPTYDTGKGQDEARKVIKHMMDSGFKLFYVPVEENGRNEIMDYGLHSTMGKVVKPCEMQRLIQMNQTMHLATDVASEVSFIRTRLTRDLVIEKILQKTFYSFDPLEDCIDLVFELDSKEKKFYSETSYRTLSLGDRVRRGPDWIFNNQDSELPGTVIGKKNSTSVHVKWDSGYSNYYFYDENSNSKSIRKVNEYRKVVDEMVAVGCRVERGIDWTYDDEDGGRGAQGTVLKVRDNGSVVVRWDCKETRLYKVGMDGLIEVQLCDPSSSSMGFRNSINQDIVNEDEISLHEYNRTTKSDTVNEDDLGNNRCGQLQDDDQFDRYIIKPNSAVSE